MTVVGAAPNRQALWRSAESSYASGGCEELKRGSYHNVLENGLKSVTHLGLTKDHEDQDKDEQDGRSLARQKQKTWDAPAGELMVTVLRANDLRDPDDIIRDLSTFVGSSAIYVALAAVVLFLLCSFFFYWLYLGSDIDVQKGDGLSEV